MKIELQELRELQKKSHDIAKKHGWYNDPIINYPQCFMLMVSELAEAMEAHRNGDAMDNKIPQFRGVEAELADVIIRILDFAEATGRDVIGAMLAKVEMNAGREYKHGGKLY